MLDRRFVSTLLACALATPAFANDVSDSGFVCRQATDFLEFCGETQGDDYRGWRFADQVAAVWWLPSDPEMVARIEAIPAKPLFTSEDARKRVLAEPFYDVRLLERLETQADWVIGFDAETIVHAVEFNGEAWVHSATWFQLNGTLLRIETLWPGSDYVPQYKQAHAAFLWAIRFNERGE